MTYAFSIKAACNIIFESGYSMEETESEILKLKDAGKIQNGYILSEDLPAIKKLNLSTLKTKNHANY